jgi:CheY-like chemotaxis protein
MAHSILVVDDETGLRALYRTALERKGYEVFEAANGAEALQQLMSHPPDVLVMDMLMPMMGGEAVVRRIRQMPALKDMRILVLTAYPRFQESPLFGEVDEFLIKPIKPHELIESINALVGDHPSES